jgi:SAM-dependent methyltransferase
LKLSNKIRKLTQPEAYTRARRRLQRKLHPIPVKPLLAKIDQRRLREVQARYAASPVQVAKYADVEQWLKTNIERVQDLKLHRSRPKEILDLGCGGGFFLFVCQQLGHSCLGLDIEGFPLFAELIDLFQIQRRIWKIEAFQPLPDLGRKFDWITAFSTGFNRTKEKSAWGPREWDFLLDDLRKHLLPGGKIYFALNPDKNGGYYTEQLHDFFLSRGADVERERVFFRAQLVP